jgi:hypothetical protein
MPRQPNAAPTRLRHLLLGSLLLATGCDGILTPEDTLVMEVAEARVPCMGVGPTECLWVRSGQDPDPQLFYGEIEGFNFEEGYRHTLMVIRRTVANPPADGSSLAYHLKRIEHRAQSPWFDLLARTRAAETLWLTGRPDPYRMVLQRVCFCTLEGRGPVEMVVAREGPAPSPLETVLSSIYRADGRPVPPMWPPLFPTVGGLFGAIRQGAATGADTVVAQFHPQQGYPTRVYIDQSRMIADEEVEYVVLSMTGN